MPEELKSSLVVVLFYSSESVQRGYNY